MEKSYSFCFVTNVKPSRKEFEKSNNSSSDIVWPGNHIPKYETPNSWYLRTDSGNFLHISWLSHIFSIEGKTLQNFHYNILTFLNVIDGTTTSGEGVTPCSFVCISGLRSQIPMQNMFVLTCTIILLGFSSYSQKPGYTIYFIPINKNKEHLFSVAYFVENYHITSM